MGSLHAGVLGAGLGVATDPNDMRNVAQTAVSTTPLERLGSAIDRLNHAVCEVENLAERLVGPYPTCPPSPDPATDPAAGLLGSCGSAAGTVEGLYDRLLTAVNAVRRELP